MDNVTPPNIEAMSETLPTTQPPILGAIFEHRPVEDLVQLLAEWETTARAYADPESREDLDEPFDEELIPYRPASSQ